MSILRDSLINAIEAAKKSSKKRNFVQSIDLIIVLRDIDMKKPENRINEKVYLPNPLDKPIKVCVFGEGDFALKAKEAGADLVLGRADIERLGGDKKAAKKLAKEYDAFIARADLMPLIGRYLGPVLGPRGKMPEPIPPTGDVASAIRRAKACVRIRSRAQPLVQCRIGTETMPSDKIAENAEAVISAVERKLKSMHNIGAIYVKTTMGPPVKVEFSRR
ncbi:MAG: 50S ribosomal protein L1 [Candidatus Methanomethylicota archaeon]|uniref:Large ribosomal subunit protein uL1 n=1 Tax=Thermoproteota archaeon TaxID=2056631 RepID=A0A497F8K2_9CREN|nr:MAG: 50S ribosomal protein L1 [Candidatus Verstraetearchaeota archaeon]